MRTQRYRWFATLHMMASCSIAGKEVEDENTKIPNWLELPRDITANILSRLSTFDIVKSACLVCPMWWNIHKDPLLWRSIHMTDITIFFSHYFDYEHIVRYAVKLSCGHLEDIGIFHFATDDLLEFISQNASNLRSMRLVDCQDISDKGFSEAVRKLSQLEELDISLCNLSKDSIEAIGISCPLLKSFKCERDWSPYTSGADDDALIISETMPRLSRLDIKGNRLTNDGLLAILDKCPLLEYLDIQKCYNLNLSESLRKRCLEQIKDLRLPILNKYEDFDYEYYGDRVTYREYYDTDYHDDLYDPYD